MNMTTAMLSHKKKIREGKAKIIFSIESPYHIIQHFKDDITAYNNTKQDIVPGKGIINNYVSAFFMQKLNDIGMETHFIRVLNMREQLVKKVEIIPLEIVVRNIAAGSFCKRFALTEGERLKDVIIEFYYKNDQVNDPLINDEHILNFEWLTAWELEEIKITAYRINDFLRGIFSTIDIELIDFKLEFGSIINNIGNDKVILADEISPDTCRLWDNHTNVRLDKDIYRLHDDKKNVINAYREVAGRMGILPKILTRQ